MSCLCTDLEPSLLHSMPTLRRFPLLHSPHEFSPFDRHRHRHRYRYRHRHRLLGSSASSSFDDFASTSHPNLCSFVSSFDPSPTPDPPPSIHHSLVYQDLQQSISLLEPPSRTFDAPLTIPSSRHGGRGKPMSLRMLKRKMQPRIMVRFQKEKLQELMRKMESGHADAAYEDFGDSVSTAFASLICMMKMLQRHTLELRANFMDESNNALQEATQKVQEEMQESLLCLFQQVFCSTPKLMLLLMVLIADFTVYSMSRHVAVSATPPFANNLFRNGRSLNDLNLKDMFKGDISENESLSAADSIKDLSCIQEDMLADNLEQPQEGRNSSPLNLDNTTDNELQRPTSSTKPQCDNVSDDNAMPLPSFLCGPSNLQPDKDVLSHDDESAEESTRMLDQLVGEAMSDDFKVKSGGLYKLNRKTRPMFVAPVIAPSMEPDDYVCYDRTDLNYQYEIMMDPQNPLLLANYAQFMHLVRHDNYRAEELFKRAVKADPVDGEVMARMASFLWVAKGDVEEADKAYKVAVAADPSNSFHAGCYAHFLWNSGQGENAPVPNSLSKRVTSA